MTLAGAVDLVGNLRDQLNLEELRIKLESQFQQAIDKAQLQQFSTAGGDGDRWYSDCVAMVGLAASRGEGKTKLFERTLLKYTLAGVIKFSALFAATGSAAQDSLQSIMAEIETNERLRADYPEVCIAVLALENTPNRAHYQLVTGSATDTRLRNGSTYPSQSYSEEGRDFEDELPKMAQDYGVSPEEMRQILIHALFNSQNQQSPMNRSIP